MLNKEGQRELAYVARIEELRPLEGYDKVEYARIGAGWWVIVRKEQFKVGDLAIYLEVDSRTPAEEPFLFLEKRHFKVRPIRMCKVISQGLLMTAEDFGWVVDDADGSIIIPPKEKLGVTEVLNEGDFLTKKLNIMYADDEDNIRKAPSVDKYKKMAQRNVKFARTFWWRWLYRREYGKKLLFFFFGKKRDKKNGWPCWVVKTDEERCQNMPWLFSSNSQEKKEEWIATEKIDGTSTTFTMKGSGKKCEFYVCSRNVVFDKPDKQCFYDTNVYTEMAEKYDIENVLKDMMRMHKDLKPELGELQFITIQGETYGGNIQKRHYGDELKFAVFNIIFGYEKETFRLNPIQGKNLAENFGLEYVPVVDEHFKLPSTCEELISLTHGASKIDGEMREGLVFRSYDGVKSFKAVDPEFILKYHSN